MEYGGCREEHELCRKHAQWTGHSYDPCFQRGSLGLGKDWLRPSTCQWGVGSRGLSLGSVTLGPVSSSWSAGWFLGTAGSVRFGSAGKVTWNVSDSPEKPRVPSTQLLSPEGGLASAGRNQGPACTFLPPSPLPGSPRSPSPRQKREYVITMSMMGKHRFAGQNPEP